MSDNDSLRRLFDESLSRENRAVFDTIVQVARQMEIKVYLVGGMVRDLLLNVDHPDIDLVLEGDAPTFAKALGEALGSVEIRRHSAFGTAILHLQNGHKIDVAMARSETYEGPAALPKVQPGTLQSDLHRRDFTVNSMAVPLNGENAFDLIDPFHGKDDLREGVIRVLHNASFVDDPTRMFRAIRFEQRYGFQLEPVTMSLLVDAVNRNWCERLSGARLLNEVVILLKESQPVKGLRRMVELELLEEVLPDGLTKPEDWQTLERVEKVLAWATDFPEVGEPEPWRVYGLGWFASMDETGRVEFLRRLKVPGAIRDPWESDRSACQRARQFFSDGRNFEPSDVYEHFSAMTLEGLLYFLAWADKPDLFDQARLYYTKYRKDAELELSGDDLMALGLPPGAVYQTVFRALRYARLNGEIRTREGEIKLVLREFLKE